MKRKPEDAIALANYLLSLMDEKEIDPIICYSALGCAFLQLHQALGHDKKNWIKITKELAETNNWSKNEP